MILPSLRCRNCLIKRPHTWIWKEAVSKLSLAFMTRRIWKKLKSCLLVSVKWHLLTLHSSPGRTIFVALTLTKICLLNARRRKKMIWINTWILRISCVLNTKKMQKLAVNLFTTTWTREIFLFILVLNIRNKWKEWGGWSKIAKNAKLQNRLRDGFLMRHLMFTREALLSILMTKTSL